MFKISEITLKKHICITDDCKIFSLGVRSILENTDKFDISEAASSSELFALLKDFKNLPDLILLDFKLKKFGSLNGIEITKIVKQNYPEIKIIILTSFDEKEILRSALEAGVDGFMPKESVSEELIEAIDCVLCGQNYMGKSTSFQAINYAFQKRERRLDLLTKTENILFIMICKGLLNSEIADNLKISVHTVETHRCNIKNKLSIKTDIDYLKIAIEENVEEILKFYMIQTK
jgi:DNA-binding NarL/FixJ family response regulator